MGAMHTLALASYFQNCHNFFVDLLLQPSQIIPNEPLHDVSDQSTNEAGEFALPDAAN
jgi:hypothetical protein